MLKVVRRSSLSCSHVFQIKYILMGRSYDVVQDKYIIIGKFVVCVVNMTEIQ